MFPWWMRILPEARGTWYTFEVLIFSFGTRKTASLDRASHFLGSRLKYVYARDETIKGSDGRTALARASTDRACSISLLSVSR